MADDDQREEFMRPFVRALTRDDSANWLLVTNGIMWRSRNEFLRFKTQEKALVYSQGLVDQFRAQETCLLVKLDYFFAVNFAFRYEQMRKLAAMYQ